jgi:hypothetical protein
MRRRISNAAGPLISEGTPATYSPASTDHAAHAAAFPKINQYLHLRFGDHQPHQGCATSDR